mmetsp:Transcript_8897/g.21761  ORF Transcript_8897/g.21761 Transcript_8897/m.21761 type:complete len:692 (-) Transcript_8897:135-2210(-)|eukprot:CAMPEP_0197198918 /NCGR_PEP_ID=MMETSP1423-20130617/33619_1 /TAXON_ID=476441 /ORGANISM="Pseudo-nitzschia heimii, Strain UNC1101" /LENGTH=691 /DNA_ID=CAMNT_0042652765 /DNA_START=48 /DNA_END=2123 /DNA_ORIENTATION=-
MDRQDSNSIDSSSSEELNGSCININGSSDADESCSDDQLDDQFSDSDGSEDHRRRMGKSMELRRLPYEDLGDTQLTCLNFAMEHRIFLRALLGLLNERDNTATQIGMNDPNVIKCGPLKKASHIISGVWKMKYVEIRRGMLTYFEDAVSGDKDACSLLQKNIPLDASETSCRAVKIHRNGLNMMPGAIFELKVGKFGRLWLARTRKERQTWIQAINDAMVGRSLTQDSLNAHGKSGAINSRSPYKEDLKHYLKVKSVLKNAKHKKDYLSGIASLAVVDSLDIPIRWIIEQVDSNSGRTNSSNATGAFVKNGVSSGVEQLWRDLCRDTVRINQQLFKGDSGHGPEKIVGALTRNIIAVSKSDAKFSRYAIPESKAVAYARDILLSINRTRSGGDSYFCIDTLSSNSDLVVLVPSSQEADPLSIVVELDESEFADVSANDNKTGWIRTRNKSQKSWRKRFFILSESTLSFYRHATPQPHGFRKQIGITDANISVDKAKDRPGYYVICIEPKGGFQERYLYFNSIDKAISWAHALEYVAKSSNKDRFAKRSLRYSITSPSCESRLIIEHAMKNHLANLGLDSDDIDDRLVRLSAKTFSRIGISVQASAEYNICTNDPQGDESDTWATLTATFLQRFRITGGRIVCGEEIVRVGVSECFEVGEYAEGVGDNKQITEADGPSPSTRRKLGYNRRKR